MIGLLSLGARLVNLAAGATTVMVAVKHAWEIRAAWQAERAAIQRAAATADNPVESS